MCLWWKTLSDWNTSVFTPSHWILWNFVCQQCNVCKQSVIFSVSVIFSRVFHHLCQRKQQLTQLANKMLLIFGYTNEWSFNLIGLEIGILWIKCVNKILWNFVGVVRLQGLLHLTLDTIILLYTDLLYRKMTGSMCVVYFHSPYSSKLHMSQVSKITWNISVA